jgi:hypothetical protein
MDWSEWGFIDFEPGSEHNVRVFNLLDLDPVFVELIRDPLAIDLVTSLLGPGFLISNFTANIALGSMPMLRVGAPRLSLSSAARHNLARTSLQRSRSSTPGMTAKPSC